MWEKWYSEPAAELFVMKRTFQLTTGLSWLVSSSNDTCHSLATCVTKKLYKEIVGKGRQNFSRCPVDGASKRTSVCEYQNGRETSTNDVFLTWNTAPCSTLYAHFFSHSISDALFGFTKTLLPKQVGREIIEIAVSNTRKAHVGKVNNPF